MAENSMVRTLWGRILLVCSGAMYAVLLINTHYKLNFVINAALAFGVMIFLVFRMGVARQLFYGKAAWEWVLASVISILAVYTGKSTFYTTCNGWMTKLFTLLGLPGQVSSILVRLAPWAAAVLALPMALGWMLWFVHFLYGVGQSLWKRSDYIDRLYLLMGFILFAILILFTYMCTQAFYGAYVNGIQYEYDLIYSADSGNLVSLDVFRVIGSVQNDTRQPLYGLFAMPFAQLAWLVSRPLAFLPHSYTTALQLIQVFLLLVAVVSLGQMLKLTGWEKAFFYVFFSLSYPMLIFSLTVEQYLMAVFWLILMLYVHEEHPEEDISYIAATGSLLTTGILFPLVTWNKRFRVFAVNTLKLCGAFFAVMILCGRLTVFLEVKNSLALYQHYSGVDVSPLGKLMQYVNFAGATLFAPASQLDDFTYRYHISFQMVPVTTWSIAGILVLLLTAVGLVLTRKDRFTKICGAWILFSFVLLGLVGWGTIDNGLFLYSLYFGWAYAAMVFRAIEKLFGGCRYLKLAVLILLILIMLIRNVSMLKQAIVFATQFYPALR